MTNKGHRSRLPGHRCPPLPARCQVLAGGLHSALLCSGLAHRCRGSGGVCICVLRRWHPLGSGHRHGTIGAGHPSVPRVVRCVSFTGELGNPHL